MKSVRTEKDLLGIRELPGDVYYGINTLRAKENFRISKQCNSDYPVFIKYMVIVKKAAARANNALEILDDEIYAAIDFACDEIIKNDKYLQQFPVDVFQGGAGTSLNMNVNEVLANIALEFLGHQKGDYDAVNPNDHINMSQSTNDVYPTAFRLALYAETQQLLTCLKNLEFCCKNKAIEFKDILKMGRTQLQDAVPMTLGQEFMAFSTSLKEEFKNLSYAAALLLEVNLGATAIGTGINAHPHYQSLALNALCDITGYPILPSEDLIEATSDCGAYVQLQSSLKRLAVKLSKICNDLRLLSSGPTTGLGDIKLPQKQAGSSIMPGKINPVIPEVVNQVCFKVIGNDLCVTLAAEAGQLQLNAMEPVIGQALFESLHILTNALDNFRCDCILEITANQTTCHQHVMNSISIITLLNRHIGHHNGDEISEYCLRTGKSVRDAVIEKGLISEKEIDAILTPTNLTGHMPSNENIER